MNKRTMDEMIANFNQEVSKMDIAREYKMALLGMITAIGYESKKQEVVRCKDCKYKPSWREGVKEEFRDGFELIFPDCRDNPCPCQCDDGFYAHMPDDNWFCANGKAR